MVFRVQLVPADFKVPESLEAETFRIRKLTVGDVVKDFEAVISSRDHLQGVFGARNPWPTELTPNENLADLGWHETEFRNRTSFCYVVMSLDEQQYRGCSYLYPSQKLEVDAEVFLWVTQPEYQAGFDTELYEFYREWIREYWPFKQVIFPGRSLSWEAYDDLPDGKLLPSQ